VGVLKFGHALAGGRRRGYAGAGSKADRRDGVEGGWSAVRKERQEKKEAAGATAQGGEEG